MPPKKLDLALKRSLRSFMASNEKSSGYSDIGSIPRHDILCSVAYLGTPLGSTTLAASALVPALVVGAYSFAHRFDRYGPLHRNLSSVSVQLLPG